MSTEERLVRLMSVEERLVRLETNLIATDRLLTAKLDAAALAVEKAAEAQRRVNAGQNEFRAALGDQAKRVELTMLPRREFDAQHTALLEIVARNRDLYEHGIATIRDELGQLRTDVAVGPPGLPLLRSRVDTSTGEHKGKAAAIALAIAIGGLVVAIISVTIVIVTRAS